MNLSEWIDKEIDIASAAYDADPTINAKVEMHYKVVATLAVATKLNDLRLARIEAKLGLEPVDGLS